MGQRYDHDFFAIVAKTLRLAMEDEAEETGAAPTEDSRRAVEQLFSEGLAGGEIVDVFAMAGENRPELSVLSDEFLDQISTTVERPELQLALLRSCWPARSAHGWRPTRPSRSTSATSCEEPSTATPRAS